MSLGAWTRRTRQNRHTRQTQQTMRPCAICHVRLFAPSTRSSEVTLGPFLSINNFSTKVAHVQSAPPAEYQLYQLPSILSLQSSLHLAAPSWQLTNGFGSSNCAINYFTSNSLRNDFWLQVTSLENGETELPLHWVQVGKRLLIGPASFNCLRKVWRQEMWVGMVGKDQYDWGNRANEKLLWCDCNIWCSISLAISYGSYIKIV